MATKQEVAEEMKAVAEDHPFLPVTIPPPRHYRMVDGLHFCFTLDIIRERRFYHLSISQLGFKSPPNDEEVAPWLEAFFGNARPFEVPTPFPPRHFFAERRQINLS